MGSPTEWQGSGGGTPIPARLDFTAFSLLLFLLTLAALSLPPFRLQPLWFCPLPLLGSESLWFLLLTTFNRALFGFGLQPLFPLALSFQPFLLQL